MKASYLIIVLVLIMALNVSGQDSSATILNVNVDSLLARYHLLGIKIFVNKVGVFSLKDKKISLKRSDFNDKLLITLSRSVSLSQNDFGAKFDYKFSDRWLIRGESYRRSWGQQSGINLLFQIEY